MERYSLIIVDSVFWSSSFSCWLTTKNRINILKKLKNDWICWFICMLTIEYFLRNPSSSVKGSVILLESWSLSEVFLGLKILFSITICRINSTGRITEGIGGLRLPLVAILLFLMEDHKKEFCLNYSFDEKTVIYLYTWMIMQESLAAILMWVCSQRWVLEI